MECPNDRTLLAYNKGGTCINIQSELHASSVIRNPSRYGVATDFVTFVFDRDGHTDESNDLLVGRVIGNGWIKITHSMGPGVDHWNIVFSEYAMSRLEIAQLLRNVLFENPAARSNASLSLEGREDGFYREYDYAEGGLSKYLEEEASVSG